MENLDKNPEKEIATMDDQPQSEESKGKVTPEQRKEELRKLIEEEGIFSLNYSDLSRKYGVSHTQVHRDVEGLMSEMPSVNWVAILNKSQHELEYTIRVVSKAMEESRDPKTRSNLAGQLSEMVIRKTSLMERMDRLLPANMKPEPVTITYRSVAVVPLDKAKEAVKEPDDNLGSVLTDG
jgi:hypothetical protein